MTGAKKLVAVVAGALLCVAAASSFGIRPARRFGNLAVRDAILVDRGVDGGLGSPRHHAHRRRDQLPAARRRRDIRRACRRRHDPIQLPQRGRPEHDHLYRQIERRPDHLLLGPAGTRAGPPPPYDTGERPSQITVNRVPDSAGRLVWTASLNGFGRRVCRSRP